MAWAIDSIANPHLNNDLSTIIAFRGETFGLASGRPELADHWTMRCYTGELSNRFINIS